MKKFLQSKGAAWAAFIAVLVYLVVSFKSRMFTAWWMLIDVFCLFMATFLYLVIAYIRNVNRPVADKLNTWAFIFGVLFVIALFGEWIAFTYCG